MNRWQRRRHARPDGVGPLGCRGQVAPLQAGRARVTAEPFQPQPSEHRCQAGLDGDDAQPAVGICDEFHLADASAVTTVTVEHLDIEQITHQ